MTHTYDDRRGFVLPVAIGTLVIIGVLITAGFFVAQQELRIGVASKHTNMAVNIAQMGANEVMANWNGYQLGLITAGNSTTVTGTATGGTWSVDIQNSNNFIYFLSASGTVTDGGARWAGASRTIGIVTKMIFADIDPPGALTTRGDVNVKGTAGIYGADIDPTEWGAGGYCDAVPGNDSPAIVTDGSGTVNTNGQGEYIGFPDEVTDPGVVDETFTDFGNLTWAELVTLAQIEGKDTTPEGTNITGTGPTLDGAGTCDEAPLLNWGDIEPANPCGSFFPLIYHGADLRIQSGGTGQGVLLVEGDLALRGGFVFYGIIIVQGAISTQGNGNRIVGAVMASNGLSLDETFTGGSQIQYSKCAVQRSILNNANLSRARPLAERSWVDLTAVAN
jgi:hypothetical protein